MDLARRVYSRELKVAAMREIDAGRTLREVARQRELSPKLLERKIGQLTMENDFLKKACEHFRDHHPPAVVSGEVACWKNSDKRPRKGSGQR